MSRLLDVRKLLQQQIADAGILPAENIIIHRQADVMSEVESIIARGAPHVALQIDSPGGTQLSPADTKQIALTIEFELILWTVPVLNRHEWVEEEIFEDLIVLVHHLENTVAALPGRKNPFLFKGFREVDDTDYLKRSMTIETRLSLEPARSKPYPLTTS